MTCTTDTLWLSCHICGKRVGQKQVPHDAKLSAALLIKWHERMVKHLQEKHA